MNLVQQRTMAINGETSVSVHPPDSHGVMRAAFRTPARFNLSAHTWTRYTRTRIIILRIKNSYAAAKPQHTRAFENSEGKNLPCTVHGRRRISYVCIHTARVRRGTSSSIPLINIADGGICAHTHAVFNTPGTAFLLNFKLFGPNFVRASVPNTTAFISAHKPPGEARDGRRVAG